MNLNIHELAKALRDAAKSIEEAAKFRFTEEIDLAHGIAAIQAVKPKNKDVTLRLEIEIGSEVLVTYEIHESYTKKAESENFKSCIESYAAQKEGADSLAAVARLVKQASTIPEEKPQDALAVSTTTE